MSKAGIFWYLIKGKSFGFSNQEDINLDLFDTIEGELRLSWLLNSDGG